MFQSKLFSKPPSVAYPSRLKNPADRFQPGIPWFQTGHVQSTRRPVVRLNVTGAPRNHRGCTRDSARENPPGGGERASRGGAGWPGSLPDALDRSRRSTRARPCEEPIPSRGRCRAARSLARLTQGGPGVKIVYARGTPGYAPGHALFPPGHPTREGADPRRACSFPTAVAMVEGAVTPTSIAYDDGRDAAFLYSFAKAAKGAPHGRRERFVKPESESDSTATHRTSRTASPSLERWRCTA